MWFLLSSVAKPSKASLSNWKEQTEFEKITAKSDFSNNEHLDISLIKQKETDLKILEVSIEEKATGELSAGAGIGTDGTAFMFAVSENNWLGRGIKLNTTANLTPESVSGDLLVSNPNYNFTGNKVSGGFYSKKTDKPESGYENSLINFEKKFKSVFDTLIISFWIL